MDMIIIGRTSTKTKINMVTIVTMIIMVIMTIPRMKTNEYPQNIKQDEDYDKYGHHDYHGHHDHPKDKDWFWQNISVLLQSSLPQVHSSFL